MHSRVVAVRTLAASLTKVRRGGVFADHEQTLTEALEQRPHLIHRRGWSGGEYGKSFLALGKIRVPEDRCCETLNEWIGRASRMACGRGCTPRTNSDTYLPEWELLDFCREHGIVLLAFAALGHGLDPKVLDDPVITAIAERVHKTPAQIALAWAVQRGTAFLTTSTNPRRIQENFDITTLPEDAMREMRDGITTSVRFNTVVGTGVPGFIPRAS